jgi:hypothetical protein
MGLSSNQIDSMQLALWKSCLENSQYMHFHWLTLFALTFIYTRYFPFSSISIVILVAVCVLYLLATFSSACVAICLCCHIPCSSFLSVEL